MFRAFIAIDLSDEVRAALAGAQARLQAAAPRAKVAWTKVENLHLTLQFLGRIPVTRVEEIGVALGAVASWQTPLEVVVAGAGAFPSDRRARVLWLGCRDAAGALPALAKAVRAAMLPLGFAPEEHEFTAHLTLGRVKSPQPDAALTLALDSIKKDAFGRLRVAAIHLYQSQLHSDGSVYTKLSSHILKGDSQHAAKS